MSATAVALLGFVAWALFLLMSLGTLRSSLVMGGKRAANSFAASGDDLEGLGKRLTRAHANCYEFLPIAGTVMVYAIATGQTLAYVFLGGRIGQSIVHLISASSTFVLIRFAFFGVQLFIVIWWLLKLFGAL
jgi:uncharacterized MAPEG superfamily protein